jgi:hypothetical protein
MRCLVKLFFEHKDTKSQSRYRRRQNIAKQISPKANIAKHIPSKFLKLDTHSKRYRAEIIALKDT